MVRSSRVEVRSSDTAWDVERKVGLGARSFWTFVEHLRLRDQMTGQMPADKALMEVQISRLLRSEDATSTDLKSLIQKWFPAQPVEHRGAFLT